MHIRSYDTEYQVYTDGGMMLPTARIDTRSQALCTLRALQPYAGEIEELAQDVDACTERDSYTACEHVLRATVLDILVSAGVYAA